MDDLSLRSYGASHGSHAHPFHQILIGLHGTLELEVQGRGQRLSAGQGCVVPAGQRHDFESRDGSRCLVLDSDSGRWAAVAGTSTRTETALRDLAAFLAQVLDHPDGAAYPYARAVGPVLLREAWCPDAPPVDSRGRSIDWHGLRAWVATRWQHPLQVADLAARVHLSPTQFSHRCRLETGTSPMQWLRSLRLAHARALQAQGSSVAESARRAGYRSPSALTAAIRRELSAH